MKTRSPLPFVDRSLWSQLRRTTSSTHWYRLAPFALAACLLLLGFPAVGAQEAGEAQKSLSQQDGSQTPQSIIPGAPTTVTTKSTRSGTETIRQVLLAQNGGVTEVTISGSGPLTYRLLQLANPDRIVVDFTGSRLTASEKQITSNLDPVRGIRLAQFRPDTARIVILLRHSAVYKIKKDANTVIVSFAPNSSKSEPRAPAINEDSNATSSESISTQAPQKKILPPQTSSAPTGQQPGTVMTLFGPMAAPSAPAGGATSQAGNQKAAPSGQSPQQPVAPAQETSKDQRPATQTTQPAQSGGVPPAAAAQAGIQQPNPPETSPQGNQEMSVALNLENADLYQVLRIIGSELKINYVVDPAVKGAVTINTAGPVSRADLFSVLETILQVNGAAIIKTGGYYRIVSASDAKIQAVPLEFAKTSEVSPAPGETLVLEVFPMHFVSAAEMGKVLAPFISPAGQVIVNEKGNILLVLETPPKLKQVSAILSTFDNYNFSRERVRLFPVINNSAKSIITELQDIFAGYSFTGSSAVRFVPMESLNSVLAISPSPEVFTEIETWVHQLDQPPQEVGEQNFVYPVQNAKASDLRDILIELYGGSVPMPESSPAVTASLNPANPMVSPVALQEAQKAQAPPSPERIQGRLHILSDDKNNALIVQATPRDYEVLKRTLVQLDVLPRQVLIDAKIYQVNLTGDLSLGISYYLNQQSLLPGPLPLSTSGSFSAGQSGGSLQTSTFAILSQTRALQMFLNATDQRGRIQMLSAPSILVTDNTSARIQVGASVPVPIGSALTPVQSNGSSVFAQTIQYEDTGVILTVTPHINSSGVVTLNLNQEVSSAVPNTTSQIVAPVINKSAFQTSVVLADGEPLALGGMITTSNNVTTDRIPGLGEIPFIGALFGTTSRQTSRTELVLILTPHVQQSLPQAAAESQEFIQSMRELNKDMQKMK